MARFARIDSQIRANRLILANRFGVPELNPILCESRFGGLKSANRRFEAIRANRSHVMKIGIILRIAPKSRCESPGHRARKFLKMPDSAGGPESSRTKKSKAVLEEVPSDRESVTRKKKNSNISAPQKKLRFCTCNSLKTSCCTAHSIKSRTKKQPKE